MPDYETISFPYVTKVEMHIDNLAETLCINLSQDQLFQLIEAIDTELIDDDFTIRLEEYCKKVLDG